MFSHVCGVQVVVNRRGVCPQFKPSIVSWFRPLHLTTFYSVSRCHPPVFPFSLFSFLILPLSQYHYLLTRYATIATYGDAHSASRRDYGAVLVSATLREHLNIPFQEHGYPSPGRTAR